MKRQGKEVVAKPKQGRKALLQWLRSALDNKNDIQVICDEENIQKWCVVLKPDMFEHTQATFEFDCENGTYQPYDDATQTELRKAYDEHRTKAFAEPTELCIPIHNTFYKILMQGNVITQENMATGKVRDVRCASAGLASYIRKWCDKYKPEGVPGVCMMIYFADDFPFTPPFVRVRYPRFMQWTGHVTIGGSVCTQDLTSDGWKSNMNFTGLMLQLRTNIVDGNGKIDMHTAYEYSELEAIEAFKRVARDHGWTVPSHSFLTSNSSKAI